MTESRFKTPDDEIKNFLDTHEELPPELQVVGDNMKFEKDLEEHPIPRGVGKVDAFGYECWDINAILKGNYWRRSIYTTDKLCKLFLKADLNQKKKYLRKRNPMEFNYIWLILLLIGIPIALLIIVFLLPRLAAAF